LRLIVFGLQGATSSIAPARDPAGPIPDRTTARRFADGRPMIGR
jgi:hypothetical protein